MARQIDPREIMPARLGVASADLHFLAELYGFRFYQTGVHCRNSHQSPRRRCLACRRERWRHWRDRHPEAALAHLERLLAEKGKMPLSMNALTAGTPCTI